MNRLYKTYLLLRYIAKKAITGDFGLDIKIEELDVPSFVKPYETEHVSAFVSVANSSASASFKTESPQDISTNILIENQLEPNLEFTMYSGLMIKSSSDIQPEINVGVSFATDRPRKINSNIPVSLESSFTAGLYVDDVVPLIIFDIGINYCDCLYEVTASISESIAFELTSEFSSSINIEDSQADITYLDFIEGNKVTSNVFDYYANNLNMIIENVKTLTINSRIITRYIPNYVEFDISIGALYLPFTAEFEIQESTVVNLEHPTIFIDYENVVTAEVHSETENRTYINVESNGKVDPKLFVSFPDNVELNTSVTLDKTIPTMFFNFHSPLWNSLEVLLEDCDPKAYFIYSTYAKLNEYWDNTHTLNSMGNSTLDELTYHEHSYN